MNDETLVEAKTQKWFKDIDSKVTPGQYLRMCREKHGMTQKQIAEKIGTGKQFVHNCEKGISRMSKKGAAILSEFFEEPIERIR